MIIFEIITILLTVAVIFFGLYFLKFKKDKNRSSSILGYLYLLCGTVGLVTVGIVLM